MAKRFSLKNKLIFVFGTLIALSSAIEGLFAINIARKAVTEKVEAQLIDKASDTAEIIDGRINTMFQFLQGIARMPAFTDSSLSYTQKTALLNKEIAFTNILYEGGVADTKGSMYSLDGRVITVNQTDWYAASMTGKDFLT